LQLDPEDVSPNGGFRVEDLITGETWEWGEYNYVRLDAHVEPAHILSVRRAHQ
jgi:starch synthase (maltosyl-transferring)